MPFANGRHRVDWDQQISCFGTGATVEDEKTLSEIDGDEIVLLLIDTSIVTGHFPRFQFLPHSTFFIVSISFLSGSFFYLVNVIGTDKLLTIKLEKWKRNERNRTVSRQKLLIGDFLSLPHVMRYDPVCVRITIDYRVPFNFYLKCDSAFID